MQVEATEIPAWQLCSRMDIQARDLHLARVREVQELRERDGLLWLVMRLVPRICHTPDCYVRTSKLSAKPASKTMLATLAFMRRLSYLSAVSETRRRRSGEIQQKRIARQPRQQKQGSEGSA